ncbi:hypothetical protein Cni_G22262 [Canna indica]|uniref:Uncharacterized protein n=1 Tax=Canna indica TaxID=4628 RepID=A0AAQ3KTZ0_9LILI|nr:hypothetical protein Cni_G22262 [Canna indica]
MSSISTPMEATSALSTTLLVLVSCNLLLLLLSKPPPNKSMQFEPLTFFASRLSAVLMAYLSTSIYAGSRRWYSPQKLLSRLLWTWRRPALTAAYVELFATSSSSLLMALRALAGATRGEATLEALAIAGSLALLARLGPVLCSHSEIACRLSLVAAVVEEDCAGMSALRRAEELVGERKLQGLALTVGLGFAEQAALMVLGIKNGGGGVWSLIFAGPVVVVMRFFTYLAYTVFYFECKKRREEIEMKIDKE